MGALSFLLLCGTCVAAEPPAASDASDSETPPAVQPVAPGWSDPAETETPVVQDVEPAANTTPQLGHGAAGPYWLFATGKAMPGYMVRAGRRMVWVDMETSLIFLTGRSEELDPPLLGSQFGCYFAFRPLYGKRGELTTGVGSDAYWLWNLHGDAWEVALSLRLAGHAWLTKKFGLFATARAYPLATSGLELGVKRDGTSGLPVLFGAGVEWRL